VSSQWLWLPHLLWQAALAEAKQAEADAWAAAAAAASDNYTD